MVYETVVIANEKIVIRPSTDEAIRPIPKIFSRDIGCLRLRGVMYLDMIVPYVINVIAIAMKMRVVGLVIVINNTLRLLQPL